MVISLSKITDAGMSVEEDVILPKHFYEKSSILDIPNMHVSGRVYYDYESNLSLDLQIEGIFLINDAVTLDEITYPFSCEIAEKIDDIEDRCGDFYEKSKNILDINGILWENIVLEIPIRVTNTKEEIKDMKGNGWELVNESKDKVDPRLMKLTELLKEGKEE